jgi:hypothetical protein
MELIKIRYCEYRNCNKIVEGKSSKKFCCKSCRSQESVYEMRSRKSIKKEKDAIKDILNTFKNGYDEKTYELYKSIFLK